VHWGYPRDGRIALPYQVAVARTPGSVAIVSFDNTSSTYANGDEMVQHYWDTRRGACRNAAAHIHRHFESQRDALDSPANRAIASRLSADEQAAIYLLIESNATAHYTGGITTAQARAIITNHAGIFDEDDIDVDMMDY
jgi:hypothetical protein